VLSGPPSGPYISDPVRLESLTYFLAGVTTWGAQPSNLTAENINEFNPVAARAMLAGLGSVLLLQTVWGLVVVLPVLLLPRLWAAAYSYAWAFGHAADPVLVLPDCRRRSAVGREPDVAAEAVIRLRR
jgi:hypothetical protein